MRGLSLVSALALGMAVGAAAAPQVRAQAGPSVDLAWKSNATTPFEVARELQSLYLSLYNTGNLRLRTVPFGGARTVEALLREQGVFFGDHFPVALDALLCDLNPGLCRRAKAPVSSMQLQDASSHVGGFEPSYGNWRVSTADSLKIPDYRFRAETTLVRISVPAGWTPDDFQESGDLDCSAWGASCADLVARFNPRVFAKASRDNTATLPQLQLSTVVPIQVDEASRYGSLLTRSIKVPDAGNDVAAQETTRSLNAAVPAPVLERLGDRSITDFAVEQINPNLAPMGEVKQWSGPPETAHQGLRNFLRAIHHPYGQDREIPATHRGRVAIAVIDSAIHEGHCDWKRAHLASGEELAPGEDPLCDTVDELALADQDHVAHVAGVIAAQPNGRGAVGVNPYADLYFLSYDKSQGPDDQIRALAAQLIISVPDDAQVINLSVGFEQPAIGGIAGIKQALDIHRDRSLIVAAAGNEGLDLREDCRVLPACLNDLENVITVVGLNGDIDRPSLWQSQTAGTNSSPDFDIGAVAEDVFSTVSGNRYAHMSGTSAAAPQVTAAASLIFAAGERVWASELDGARIPPKIVKDRLIYTADIFPELSGSLLSGRLNVDRAIEVANDQFVIRTDEGEREIVGQTLEVPDVFTCRTPVEAEQFQNWWDLRRMTFQQESGRFLLFKHTPEVRAERYAPLRQFPSCLLTTLSAPVKVLTREGEIVEFTFADIRDYTSRLLEIAPVQ